MPEYEKIDNTIRLSAREAHRLASASYCFVIFASIVLGHHLGWMTVSYAKVGSILSISAIHCAVLYYFYRVTQAIQPSPFTWLMLTFVAFIVTIVPIYGLSYYLLSYHALEIAPNTLSWIFKLVLVWVVFSVLAFNIYALGKQRNFDRRFQALTTQAHMRILAEQLSPHFVFNALNSLRFMLAIDSERARIMSNDIRALIEELDTFSQQNLVPLQQDIDFLEKYLRLVKVQLGRPFDINIHLSQHCSNPLVLPLILQLLAENCVKHCLNKLERGTLSIRVRQYRTHLIYRVCSTNPENSSHRHNTESPQQNTSLSLNVGVSNIQNRLSLYYGNHYHYRFKKHKHTVSTLIIFPCQPGDAHGR